jgi:hypothetical protein
VPLFPISLSVATLYGDGVRDWEVDNAL